MPCNDLTELLDIRLDHHYRVTGYSLQKKTCGGEVNGKSLLKRWLKGKSTDHLLNTSVQDVLQLIPSRSDLWEYLTIKHFLAVQGCLAVVTGQSSGRADNWCTLECIEYNPEGISVKALISVEAITDEIRACGKCCRSNKLLRASK
jgi:hypothetical protein